MSLPFELRYALRRLGREPGFTAVAVLMLAIGIGASTAMFSVVHAVLLQPFGVDEPGRVVVAWPEHRGIVGEFPFNSRLNLLGRVAAFDQVAVFGSVNWSDTVRLPNAEPFEMSGSTVSASFFDVLRARPLLGRTFRPEDDAPAATRAFVLSHAAWIRRFGGDPNIVGRRVNISGDAEIVGVMPPEFFFPRGAEYLDARGSGSGEVRPRAERAGRAHLRWPERLLRDRAARCRHQHAPGSRPDRAGGAGAWRGVQGSMLHT